MRTLPANLLLRKCLHPGALAGAQGGVQGGHCQAEGRQGSFFVVILVIFVIISIPSVLVMTKAFCTVL
jgi:hypothetical protein